MIAVSPAVNWSQQGRFNLLAEAKAAGTSPADLQKQVERSDRTRALIRSGATFDQYVKEFGTDEMTAARWTFIQKNHLADATADLTGLKIPTFLALAGHDLNVDVADTERVYRRLLTGLTVAKYPDATHAMVKVESSSLEFLRAVFAPRSLYADGFLDDLTRYVSSAARTELSPHDRTSAVLVVSPASGQLLHDVNATAALTPALSFDVRPGTLCAVISDLHPEDAGPRPQLDGDLPSLAARPGMGDGVRHELARHGHQVINDRSPYGKQVSHEMPGIRHGPFHARQCQCAEQHIGLIFGSRHEGVLPSRSRLPDSSAATPQSTDSDVP